MLINIVLSFFELSVFLKCLGSLEVVIKSVSGKKKSLPLLAQMNTSDVACPGAPAGKLHVAVGAMVRLGPRVDVAVVRPVLLVGEAFVAHFADVGLEVVLSVHRLLVPSQHLFGVGVAALFALELFVDLHVPLDGVRVLQNDVATRLLARYPVVAVVIVDVVLHKNTHH